MARKTLLTEGELRRFMKLADMRPIADTRINEMGGFGLEEEMPGDDAVDDLDAVVAAGEEEGPGGDVLDVDAEVGVEDPLDDPGAEAADPELEAKFTELMTRWAEVAKEVLNIDMEVEGGEEVGGEEEVEEFELSDEEAPMGDLAPEGGEELEVGAAEVEELPGNRYEEGKEGYKQRLSQHLGKDPGKGGASKSAREKESEGEEEEKGKGKFSGDPEMTEENVVAEVARRVAARLQRENHQAEVVDQLAERIMKRLTK